MKHLFIIGFIILSTILYGQNTAISTPQIEHNKIMIGINYSTDLGYRKLNSANNEEITSFIMESRNSREKPSFGYTAGLNIRYKLSHHFDIELGTQYSNKGYSTEEIGESDFIISDNTNPLFGENASDRAKHFTMKQDYNYHYLDIPIRIIYKLGNKKIQFVTSIGFVTNILMNATQITTLEYIDKTNKENYNFTKDLNRFNISPMLSAGVSYSINEKISFHIEPTFRYGIFKTTDTPITENLWNAGINVACYYTL